MTDWCRSLTMDGVKVEIERIGPHGNSYQVRLNGVQNFTTIGPFEELPRFENWPKAILDARQRCQKFQHEHDAFVDESVRSKPAMQSW